MIEGDRSPAGFFTPGEALSAGKLNVVADMAARSRTTINLGVRTMQGSFGTVYDVEQSELENYYDYPFKVSVAQGDSAGKWKVFIRAGTVNNFIPKTLDGAMANKYLDEMPQPYLEMNSASGDVKYVILRAKVDENKKFFPDITDVYLADSREALTDSNDEGHLLIASIALLKTSGSITGVSRIDQYIYGCQNLVRVKPGSQPAIWNWTSR